MTYINKSYSFLFRQGLSVFFAIKAGNNKGLVA
jgi:hypothetical protein